jgi:hypothetical protein
MGGDSWRVRVVVTLFSRVCVCCCWKIAKEEVDFKTELQTDNGIPQLGSCDAE